MEFCLRIVLLLFLVSATLTQDGFDLGDALGPDPTPKPVDKPPKSGGGGGGGGGFELDLGDALGPDPTPKPTEKPPKSGGGDGFGLDLEDALGPDPKPKPKPADDLPKSGGGGGGGNFDDSDLFGVSDGDYKPEGGKKRAGGAEDPGYNQGGADQPQDPELLWGQILKMLNANMPEEFFMWINNLKQTIAPLLERALDLLQAIP
ncbi:hypothetical protein D5F01_LYC23654 [Larimichthys crocea]|uniref:CD99 antigen-like protein 2 n=1 Tax=Larimichthys crocea TaxID=215358 RepID=A0A6G0HHR5_LARCR|nr:hypothetical protein D5F01_LYC23654 [Larimichthys crocea]